MLVLCASAFQIQPIKNIHGANLTSQKKEHLSMKLHPDEAAIEENKEDWICECIRASKDSHVHSELSYNAGKNKKLWVVLEREFNTIKPKKQQGVALEHILSWSYIKLLMSMGKLTSRDVEAVFGRCCLAAGERGCNPDQLPLSCFINFYNTIQGLVGLKEEYSYCI
eukprot:CAMPEP_0117754712 /NCGR_PEP_ID=MMETSP0947-20121206/12987_1 /TAXON_ID=44440 /ORGANISM="Chattonella subsalsa, Strain CCMP2191" /LENGTH=166 /DNA_ID=CAMNT_0005573843 /DNA_START=362 /DNA_END=862 /DNA_ORIENTATION=+